MTLETRLRIVEPTPVRPVFDEIRRLLGAEQAKFKHGESGDKRNLAYINNAGQGYDAWAAVIYGPDGPLRDEADCEAEDCDQYPCTNPSHLRVHQPQASIEISVDTPYGYRAENGAGCADLHAWLVSEMGRWCDARGLTWLWFDEFRGEWHPSTDPVTILGDPVRGAR